MEAVAFRRLRATAEPKVKASADRKVPRSALDEAEKATLTTAFMRIALDGLTGFCFGVRPAWLTRFDELRLSGGTYIDEESKETKFQLGFGFRLSNGDYDKKIGIAYLPYGASKKPSAN